MTQHLETRRADGVLTVTFRRPEAFNALSDEMAAGFVTALTDAQTDPEVRVVLVHRHRSRLQRGRRPRG